MSDFTVKKRVRYRTFARIYILTLLVFVVINILIWVFFTKRLLSPGSRIGDLARLSYLVKISQEREMGINLPRKHVAIGDFTEGKVDMITVGDSFSMGGGGGKNNYYQDYIASRNNFTVVDFQSNIGALKPGIFMPVNLLAILYNNGMLDRLKPRYVLLETAERAALERLVDCFSFQDTQSLDRLFFYYQEYKPTAKRQTEISTFIDAGKKFINYNIKDLFSAKRINDNVYRLKLQKSMFSEPYGDRLYYIFDEEKPGVKVTSDKLRTMNNNLNFIAGKLAKKNIRLVFMPVVSKLNLYGAYADPPRNDSIFFEDLRKLPKKYLFIDTKALLRDSLQRGEKDIFYKDDTHWSWKASQKIFDTVRFN